MEPGCLTLTSSDRSPRTVCHWSLEGMNYRFPDGLLSKGFIVSYLTEHIKSDNE